MDFAGQVIVAFLLGETSMAAVVPARAMLVASCVGVLMLAGCVSPVKTVSGLSDEEASKIGINQIRVEQGTVPMDPELRPELQAALEKHLRFCATGDQKRDVVVKVDNFKRRNPAAVILIGDTNNLAGPVQIVSPGDNKVLAEYYVDELQGGGGLLGLAILSAPEKNLSNGFARKICSNVFKRPGVDENPPNMPPGTASPQR
jgi:hypothetical protein